MGAFQCFQQEKGLLMDRQGFPVLYVEKLSKKAFLHFRNWNEFGTFWQNFGTGMDLELNEI